MVLYDGVMHVIVYIVCSLDQTCMDTVEVILSDWHDTVGTKSKVALLLMMYKSMDTGQGSERASGMSISDSQRDLTSVQVCLYYLIAQI